MKPITINTHIDCLSNSKCSVGDILLATKQGAFESVFGTFSVKVGNSRTCQMFGAIVVNKWDTMQTHQNVPTIDQVQTRIMSQAMSIAAEHPKVGVE